MSTPRLQSHKINLTHWTFVGLAVLILLTVWRNAWLSDDCYITFRTVYNALNGHGLRWNVSERVQTFTHPLWLFSLLPVYKLTGSAWLTSMILGLGFTALGLVVFFRRARTPIQGLICGVLFLGSRAFIDFSTSGLENPLTNLLLMLFVFEALANENKAPNLLKLGLLASLLMLNRLDHLLLVAPVLGWALWRVKSWQGLGLLVLGMTPLILWELFSLLYYGFPFPNTYYAKVLTDWPREILIRQGFTYLWQAFLTDPLTMLTIFGVSVVVWTRGNVHFKMVWIGVLLYLLYIIWVGGDFMAGRFVVSPFVLSVALLSRLNLRWKPLAAGVGLLLVIALFQPYCPLYIGKNYYQDRAGNERELYPHGIVDEKGMAWRRTGIPHHTADSELLKAEQEVDNLALWPGGVGEIRTAVAVGMLGYRAGPGIHVLDQLALTDPLLARMPAERRELWRIGHFFRTIPEGYYASIETGENQLTDEDLAVYLDRLRVLTEAPLFAPGRLREIVRFNFGGNDHLVDRELYLRYEE